jgi:hypothetical protein
MPVDLHPPADVSGGTHKVEPSHDRAGVGPQQSEVPRLSPRNPWQQGHCWHGATRLGAAQPAVQALP